MILHLTEYKSNHKYNKNEINKFVDCLCEEIIKGTDVLKRYRQYENGDETKASLGSLFNDIVDEISRKFEVKRVKFNISSKVGLSNYIEIFFSLPYGVTKKSLSHYKIRLSDHPPKKKEFNEISIPIVGSTVNKLKDDIMKVVDSRIELINDAEHKYLYGECFNMVKRYNYSKKFIKENTNNKSFISFIPSVVRDNIKDFRNQVNELAKLIYDNRNVLFDGVDTELEDVEYECDLGQNNEWYHEFLDTEWNNQIEDFEKIWKSRNVKLYWKQSSIPRKFYLAYDKDFITSYIRKNETNASQLTISEIATYISSLYNKKFVGDDSTELYSFIMTNKGLENGLKENYEIFGYDMTPQEYVNNIIKDIWDYDYIKNLDNMYTYVSKTINAYNDFEELKEYQVDNYENWLKNK